MEHAIKHSPGPKGRYLSGSQIAPLKTEGTEPSSKRADSSERAKESGDQAWLERSVRARLSDRSPPAQDSRMSGEATFGPHGNPKYFSSPDAPYDYKTFMKQHEKGLGQLPSNRFGTKVAVIGGGLAGLNAARELAKVGLVPVIFEAAGRFGGRLDSRPMGAPSEPGKLGGFAELGAMRIPVGGRAFNTLLKLLNVTKGDPNNKAALFPNPGVVNTLVYYNGARIRWPAGGEIEHAEMAQMSKEFGQAFKVLLEPLRDAQQCGDAGAYRKAWNDIQNRFNGASFLDGLKNMLPDWTDAQIAMFSAVGTGSGGVGHDFPLSMLEIVREKAGDFERKLKSLFNGSDEVIKRLLRADFESAAKPGEQCSLDDGRSAELHLNTRVHGVHRSPDGGVEVAFSAREGEGGSWGESTRRTFSAVVVATTTGAMEQMGLAGGANDLLAPEVRQAIKTVHFVSASKIFIPVQCKFWEGSSDIPQNIQTDTLPHGVYALSYPGTEQGVVCLNYAFADKAVKDGGVPNEDRIVQCLTAIREASPEFLQATLRNATVELPTLDGLDETKPSPEVLRRFANALVKTGQVQAAVWHNDPNHRGAFKQILPDQEEANRQLFFQPFDAGTVASSGLVLAGDSVSFAGGWADGAVQTSITATQAVIRMFDGHLPEHSPLDVLKIQDARPSA